MRARFQAPGVQVVALVPGGRACAAADHGGDAVRKRFVDLLRRNEMDVAVDGARGDDQVLAGDHFGGRAHHQFRIDACHGVRVARLAHLHDAAVANADVAFDDAPVIDDQRVGDHQVERAGLSFARRAGALPHAVANDLAAAEGDLVAIAGEVLLHFDDQLGVGQPHAIARGGTVEIGISSSRNFELMTCVPALHQ